MAKIKVNKILLISIAALAAVTAFVGGVAIYNIISSNSVDTSHSNGLKASELKYVDATVEYGDYDAMEKLAKDIQYGYMLGKVVKIDGIVSHSDSFYRIVENSSYGASIGVRFIISGNDVKYPSDGAHVVLTGKVIEAGSLNFIIRALPESVEVRGD